MIQLLKELFIAIGDYIDTKLQTKTGRMTLLVLSGLVIGVSVMSAINDKNNYDELRAKYDVLEKKKDSLQIELNNNIKNADVECNEKIKEGALLQQQLRYIYDNKIEENKKLIKEQQQLVKEKEKVLSIQEDNINKLNLLNR